MIITFAPGERQLISYTVKPSNNRRRTTSVQQTKSMPPIAFPIEIYSTIWNLREWTETKTASTNHKYNIKLSTFIAQIVCPLLCLVDFYLFRTCFIEILLIQHPCRPHPSVLKPINELYIGGVACQATSEIGTASLQRTRVLPPVCLLFRGFTVGQIPLWGDTWGNTLVDVLGHDFLIPCFLSTSGCKGYY